MQNEIPNRKHFQKSAIWIMMKFIHALYSDPLSRDFHRMQIIRSGLYQVLGTMFFHLSNYIVNNAGCLAKSFSMEYRNAIPVLSPGKPYSKTLKTYKFKSLPKLVFVISFTAEHSYLCCVIIIHGKNSLAW